MFKYDKKLVFPICDYKKDLRVAKYLITQFGGPNGELSAALRYFSQKFTMPDEKGKALLNDISVEEFSHIEMICAMFEKLCEGASQQEMEEAGLGEYFVEHGKALFPLDSFGNSFVASYFASTGDVIANLSEDLAAEQKARATYEALIKMSTDPKLISALLFLRQREIVHFNRFKQLYDYYKKMGY